MGTHSGRRRPTVEARMLTIGALSRATRIPVETLRSWERRYGAPAPHRKPSGHRVYPATTVEQLRIVARLLAHGHRPGEVLGLSARALDSMLALSETDGGRPRAPAQGDTPPASTEEFLDSLMRACQRLDRDALAEELRVAWVRLAPMSFLEEIAGPFMVRVGCRWADRSLGIRHEHLASACLSDFLRSAREPFDRKARGARVLVAMLPGDEHEGGLLMVALLLAVQGYRIVYLGAETPPEEIARAALEGDVEAVALSFSAAVPRARVNSPLTRLRKALPARVALWVGGAGAPVGFRGAQRFATLSELASRIVPGD